MRDMYMVSSTTAPSSNAIQTAIITPEQEVQLRLRLLQSLQTTLETQALLQLFFKQLQTRLAVNGMRFIPGNQQLDTQQAGVKFGRDNLHHCDYSLSLDGSTLGKLVFSRNKRFAENELQIIEDWLGMLVHPLRNALQYQAALRLTMLDPLTGIGNRTSLEVSLRRELHLAERYQQDFSLLLIDVDHFKQINDQHGHALGDEVLKQVAGILRDLSRSSDLTFRYGGEEFVVLLGKTGTKGAHIIAERIRKGIGAAQFTVNEKQVQATVSIGIATHNRLQQEHVNAIFERADQALYQAKHEGRNRVVFRAL